MAENSVGPEPEWSSRALDAAEDTLVAMETLLATLRAFEDVLRHQAISASSSTEYCDNFCQALMHYAGSRNSVEHGLPLLEVYCLSINCFAAARSHLTAESDSVALVLKRLALSCFELLLSVPENEIPYEAWVQFHHSVQIAHETLLQYGSTDLQALLQITGEGGAWSNPILTALLTGQHTTPEEVDAYISLEGEGFMEMRVKHLEKMGELAKAVVLAKACTECCLISNQPTFRQTYVSLLCHLLPNEEAIVEISRLDCKDVLEITCNLETEGEENTAFILCTTFLTQQLQQQNLYCSWELILLWSKLQRKIDPSSESLLERCLQLGAIAKTVHHLLYLVRVIQAEMQELGLASSVELSVKALQLPKQDDSETRISVCKTVSCLLPEDLEVLRACLLTEFLLGPCQEVFSSLEELYLRPDQKYDQENGVIPNSLRCELLLALKAYWPFDPEFWDWKTLKYHCITLLGLVPESEGEVGEEEEEVGMHVTVKQEPQGIKKDQESENQNRPNGRIDGLKEEQDELKSCDLEGCSNMSKTRAEREIKKLKFYCQICKRSVTESQILHHSKRHADGNSHRCPVCLERFQSRKELVPHMKQHIQNPLKFYKHYEKKKSLQKMVDEDEIEPGEITVDPSLMLYYQSTHDPDVLHHIVHQSKSENSKHVDGDEHITFDYIDLHFNLRNRDEYPCPGTHCTKTFKHSKYLYVHLKSEHKDDENVKHFHEMRDKREKCTYCRRHYVSAYHHRKHRKVHCLDEPYTCVVIGCGAQFSTSNELVTHKQTHGYQLNYRCELKGCYVTYSDLGQIYHHEAQHFRDAAFSCTSPECKKFFLSKKEFINHLATHGIVFSEKDFETQRKAKQKLIETVTEDTPCPRNSMVNGDKPTSSSTSCASSLCASGCKEPKGMITSVAVCFDGSKFTCGFEKCGMTFSRARDVQRHLKCAHPEHLKLENKEHKHDKERGSKAKGLNMKTEPSSEEKGKYEPSTQKPPNGADNERKESPQPSHNSTNSSSLTHNDAFKAILIGLSKLDLNSSNSHNGSCEPSNSISGSTVSQIALHQTVVAKCPVVLLQKKHLHVAEETVQVKPDQVPETTEIHTVESLATAKPYICKVKGCDFRTAQSFSLLRHLNIKHGHTIEQAKKMTSLKTTSFKPYTCQICSKSHREKTVLKAHYIQIHNLSEAAVEKMNCVSAQPVESRAPEPTKHSAQPLKDALEVRKKEVPSWQQRCHRRKASMMRRENEKNLKDHYPSGEEKGEEVVEDKVENREILNKNERNGEGEEGGSPQGRTTRRLVTKSNLCYILTKFSKPFHCVVKGCDAAFSTQGGLVRHLQVVHQYNRSQLLLEKDFDVHQNAEVKKDPTKKRPVSHSDEPQPQYKCHFANCNASYHLKSSLVRHTRELHCQPPEPILCQYKGCKRVFNHASALKKHILYSHCEYYDSFVLRLQSTHKKSISGCQKKLIVASPSPQTEEPTLSPTQSQKLSPTSEIANQSEEISEDKVEKKIIVTNKKRKEKRYEALIYRSHEEALQMCQDRCLLEGYPCMVQNCDSVVKYMQSMQRHYLTVHCMYKEDFYKNEDKLVFNAEQLEELIQRKSARPTITAACTPNGVRKMEYQTEPENSGGQSMPMSLHSIKTDSVDEDNQNPLGFPEEEPPPVEINNVLVGADDVLYGEPSTGGHTEEPAATTPNSHNQEEKLKWQNINTSLPAVTVDLSPPSSLRFTNEECFQDTLGSKEGGKMMNGSMPLSSPPARQPLKRKNELSEQPSNLKDAQPLCPPHPFDIASYKPMGFESSFLKFIQETSPSKEEDVTSLKRRESFKRSCSVKENNQLGISHTRSKRTRSPLLKPLVMTRDFTSVHNLKLDKALAGCGDLAIKQLQFLRPVVVLERPMCNTILPDLFPPDTNNSKLRFGS
ncbi:zinc finger protein Rlf [Lampris incognitus]|uniref:zinc finger protein Rlf n=1 Tax=Lampris incognitus TaxID=2546036 RepID=UPI0024B55E20|nr:zinc finger protein Rlf [Lampris incognitus]